MRSGTLTVMVERTTESVTARRNQSLLTTLKDHYHGLDRDKDFSTMNWRCAVGLFWFTAISAQYTNLLYTLPHLVMTLWQQDEWALYWAKVFICFGFVQLCANWMCIAFYQSFHKVTDDRPELTKTLWDQHPLEMGKKLDDHDARTSTDPRVLPWRHCMKCQMEQPPRAHHCKICQKCVLKRDHHCFILGSCIGYRNQRYFIVFTFYLFFASLFSLCLSYIYIRDFYYESKTTWDYFLPYSLFQWVAGEGCDHVFLILLSHWYLLILMLPMSISFFAMSIFSVIVGKTMYEAFKNLPIKVINSRSENMRSVFGDFWPVNFLFPAVILFKQPGDGTEWPGVFKILPHYSRRLHQSLPALKKHAN